MKKTPNSINWPKLGILLPIGLTSFFRGVTLFPTDYQSDKLPAPLVFHNVPGGPVVFSLAWILAGLFLCFSVFIGDKVTVYHPKGAITRLRLDDASILANIFMVSLWGLSYYGMWISDLAHSTDYISGRNYLPWAIAGFVAWYTWFSDRSEREALSGKIKPNGIIE